MGGGDNVRRFHLGRRNHTDNCRTAVSNANASRQRAGLDGSERHNSILESSDVGVGVGAGVGMGVGVAVCVGMGAGAGVGVGVEASRSQEKSCM